MIGLMTKMVVGGVTSYSASQITTKLLTAVVEVPKDKLGKITYLIGVTTIGAAAGYVVGEQAQEFVDDTQAVVLGLKDYIQARKEAKTEDVEED